MNLADNLFHSAERFPDKTVIHFHDRQITYAALRDDVSRLASAFSRKGIGPGSRIAVALPNTPHFALAFYAGFAAGAAVVSVNPLYTGHEMNFMFSDSRPSLIVTHPLFDPAVLEAARPLGIPVVYSDALGDPSRPTLAAMMENGDPRFAPATLKPGETAVVVYTNAVSGHPLGAQLTHDGLDFNVNSCVSIADVTDNDFFMSVIPLFHTFAATTSLHLPIRAGGSTVFHEIFSEKRVVEDIHKYPVTIFPAVPAVFQKIADAYEGKELSLDIPKGLVPGGAPCPVSLLRKLRDNFGAKVFEGYGITECGPVTMVNPIAKGEYKDGTVGPTVEGVEAKVVDEQGIELPANAEGELFIKGANMMSGYLNRPDETAHYLVDGWLKTGDLARMDEDGYFTITGLKKRMLLVGGFNVYPAEVENAIRRHPSVREASVHAIPDAALGSRVAARVKVSDPLTRNELQRFLRGYLAPYKVPRMIEFE